AASVAVQVRVLVVTTAERAPTGAHVGGPLVEVADHVVDPERVLALRVLAGLRDGVRGLVDPRIVHRLARGVDAVAELRVKRHHRRAARVVAIAVLALVTVGERGRSLAAAGIEPLVSGAEALARHLARGLRLVLRDVTLRNDAGAGDGLHLEVG